MTNRIGLRSGKPPWPVAPRRQPWDMPGLTRRLNVVQGEHLGGHRVLDDKPVLVASLANRSPYRESYLSKGLLLPLKEELFSASVVHIDVVETPLGTTWAHEDASWLSLFHAPAPRRDALG